LFTFLLYLAACSSGKQALQRGDYEESVLKAINRLRSNPEHKKARATLQEAFPLTVSYHQEKINALKSSTEPFYWEKVLDSYNTLTRLHEEIQRCPACRQLAPNSRAYLNEAAEARFQAAAERYQAGELAFKRDNSRLSAKEAYLHYRRANELQPDYRNVRAKMEEAYSYATLKVVLEQIPVHSRTVGLSHEFFQNKINEFASSAQMNEFVQFYTPQEAQTIKLNKPDHVVRLQFDDFVVGQVYLKESTETITRDSVVVGKVEVNGVKKDVYGKVTAQFTTFRKTVSSKGLMDMQILDPAANRVVNQQKMPGEFVWQSEWGTFKGDERALNKKQLDICKLREVPPPPPQDLFIEFCKPIYSQVTANLERFYRSY
jgi:sarcosine oxidase delta subunit